MAANHNLLMQIETTNYRYQSRISLGKLMSRAVMVMFILTSLSQAQPSVAENATGRAIVSAARSQIGKTVSYDPAYVSLKYPGGDIDISKGVCTDVVIRALRSAKNLDLQKLVHEDMKSNFSKYPKRWGLSRTDRSIDHRRVPNLQTFFKRKGWSLKVTKEKGDYKAGDLVTCTVAGRLPHIMIVSDKRSEGGTPMIIHNIGNGTYEEARLFEFPLTRALSTKVVSKTEP